MHRYLVNEVGRTLGWGEVEYAISFSQENRERQEDDTKRVNGKQPLQQCSIDTLEYMEHGTPIRSRYSKESCRPIFLTWHTNQPRFCATSTKKGFNCHCPASYFTSFAYRTSLICLYQPSQPCTSLEIPHNYINCHRRGLTPKQVHLQRFDCSSFLHLLFCNWGQFEFSLQNSPWKRLPVVKDHPRSPSIPATTIKHQVTHKWSKSP